MVVAVGAERFHAICHPLKYKPRPAFYLGFVVLVSILINIPKFLEFKLTSTKYVNQFIDLKKKHNTFAVGILYRNVPVLKLYL